MKVFFTAWLLINGSWTHGSYEDGWWPLQYNNEASCSAGLAFAERNNKFENVRFTCETLEDTLTYIKDLQR